MTRLVHIRKYALLAAMAAAVGGFRAITETRTAHAAASNPQLGAQIVSQGTKKGAVACARCHGYDGASDGSGAFPILAGQSASYLTEQLRNFASGQRLNAVMCSIANSLTDDEIQSVSAYYSSARPTLRFTRVGQADLVSRGQYIATEGNLHNRVQACVDCHGPSGSGERPDVPYLSGQYKHYIEMQLKMFRRGYRKDVPMGTVGHRVTDEEAAQVAAYFDQLPLPPSPVMENTHGTDRTRASRWLVCKRQNSSHRRGERHSESSAVSWRTRGDPDRWYRRSAAIHRLASLLLRSVHEEGVRWLTQLSTTD